MFKFATRFLLTNIARLFVASDWRRLKPALADKIQNLSRNPEIHPLFLKYLVLGEDRRHGYHPGFDAIAIMRALWRRVTSSKREGASTISQQLVRTITNRRDPTIRRKAREICLAVLVTNAFEAHKVAKVYLQIAYYGWQMNSFDQVFQRLGIDPANVSECQAAEIIARLKYPQPRTTPFHRYLQIRNRTQHLLALAKSKELSQYRDAISMSTANEAV